MPFMAASAGTNALTAQPVAYGTNPDQSFDPVGFGGALGGAGLGMLGGVYLGRNLSKKALKDINTEYLKTLPSTERMGAAHKLSKGAKVSELTKGAKAGAAEESGLLSKLKGSKGSLKTLLAENPKLAMGGGAALGAMLGGKILGNALTGNSHQNMSTAMQNQQSLWAQKQQEDLATISRGSNIQF